MTVHAQSRDREKPWRGQASTLHIRCTVTRGAGRDVESKQKAPMAVFTWLYLLVPLRISAEQ